MNIEVQNGVPNSQVSEVVLLPFDDYSVPISKGLLLNLIPGVRKPGDEFEGAGFDRNHPGEPVVRVGEPGTSDSKEVIWPTVIKVGSEYRMWYVCRGDSDHDATDSWEHPKIDRRRKLGFAVSNDGIKWENQIWDLLNTMVIRITTSLTHLGGMLSFTILMTLIQKGVSK